MNFSVTIDDRSFVRAARALPDKLERKVYRGAVSRAATPTLRKARQAAGSSTVRKALVKRAQSDARKGYFGQKITVKGGVFRSTRTARRRGVGAIYHPDEAIRFYRFLETGTKYHPSQPFLRSSLLSSRTEFKGTVETEIRKGIDKVAR